MSNAANQVNKQKMRDRIDKLVARCDAGIPRSFTGALQSLIAGMDYDDPAIIRSSIETGMKTLADVIGETIEKRLGWPQSAQKLCREIRDQIRQNPVESLDEVGAALQSYFDQMLAVLNDLQNGPVKTLVEKGYEIKNAAQLESDIKELQHLKKDVLDNWPWSNKELPPANVEMLNASMAALARGENGEEIEELIVRLGGKPIRESA